MEVTVQVPKLTRAKDILFKANSTSIQLLLCYDNGARIILLDPARKLRGKVVVDGTYWMISDPERTTNKDKDDDDDVDEDDDRKDDRLVTVTIEKRIRKPKDDFDVIDYDWKGVYSEDEAEVTFREYDQAEKLDIRDYAASLGVDIDNINMSMVDKVRGIERSVWTYAGLGFTERKLKDSLMIVFKMLLPLRVDHVFIRDQHYAKYVGRTDQGWLPTGAGSHTTRRWIRMGYGRGWRTSSFFEFGE